MGERRATAGSARMARLLDGPIIPTLLALAAPTTLVLTVQSTINLVETHFIGTLGTAPLAGAAIVFPIVMVMQMVASGGLGGGIASAIARATGAGRHDRATALIGQALILATAIGLVTGGLGLVAGPAIYRALGGTGEMLAAALAYSDTIFAGMVLLWWSNALASAVRGSGEMMTAAFVILGAALGAILLSPSLIRGWGPFPRLGVVGAGLAVLSYYVFCILGFLAALLRSREGLRLASLFRFDRALMADILSVGGLSTLMTLLSSLAAVVVTGLAGTYGSLVLAGYGIGARLDALLVPPLFGLGAATVTMVGVSVGAGNLRRAERTAWLGALVAAVAMEAIGLTVAWFPGLWLRLFSNDAAVLANGARYLRTTAPCYGFLGIGTVLHFAALGAGRPRGPLVAIVARVAAAAGGGWLVVQGFGGGPGRLYVMAATALAVFAVIHVGFVLNGSLRRPRGVVGLRPDASLASAKMAADQPP
jgi:putative MATE family efflux protein